jgi:hypothetical protein
MRGARATLLLLGLLAGTARAAAPPGETIVLLRHGEKPEAGLGQLSCQGLNRSLALPAVLAKRFPRPLAIFAPDPASLKRDHADGSSGPGAEYSYVRPLATIEPTAIRLGLPVNTQLGYADITGLEAALTQPALAHGVVLVAWEHHQIEDLARHLATRFGADPAAVPVWKNADYDSLYVIHLSDDGGARKMSFQVAKQGLNDLPDACPRG